MKTIFHDYITNVVIFTQELDNLPSVGDYVVHMAHESAGPILPGSSGAIAFYKVRGGALHLYDQRSIQTGPIAATGPTVYIAIQPCIADDARELFNVLTKEATRDPLPRP
jgi:hypothetical protein